MWGVIPAAGHGTRIQPLAFSKELLPVGGRAEAPSERPKAVSEYLVERMVAGGADKICFVISPGKSDIVEYYGRRTTASADIAYVVQPQATGLCDAIFRAAPVIARDEPVLVGLPDTIWFPEDAFRAPARRPAFVPPLSRRRAALLRRRRHRRRRHRARDPGQVGACANELDLGRVQDAGRGLPRAARLLEVARPSPTSTSAR